MSATTIVSVGELLVEFVSRNKGCALSQQSEYSGPYPGGASAICLDQAARIGARTKIFGGIGEDGFGCVLVERLACSGVDTGGIALHSDRATGVAFVSSFDDGSRISISHIDNSAAELAGEVEGALPEADLLLYVSGASLRNSRLRSTILAVCDEVLARGGLISCAPNASSELMDAPKVRDALMRVLASSSILFPSTNDLELLYPGKSEDEAVNALRAIGTDVVALYRGADGAVIFKGEARYEYRGHGVEQVDSTGAGECFCGAFLAMIAEGQSIDAAGRYGNAAAALATGRRGPMEGNSSRNDIEGLLSGREVSRKSA
ncbi:MAG: carbohydrate kinase family protein [Hoeflea sp.]|uniref:carbohydrate kinase family protein n=1 Tax=Hoeflea sp. TaxID=1940281 RepID=UPI003EFAB2CE